MQESLPFALVDIQVDYGAFKNLSVLEAGNPENFKISSLIYHLVACSDEKDKGSADTCPFLSKMLIKQLSKKLFKLFRLNCKDYDSQEGLIQSLKAEEGGVSKTFFVPELLN